MERNWSTSVHANKINVKKIEPYEKEEEEEEEEVEEEEEHQYKMIKLFPNMNRGRSDG